MLKILKLAQIILLLSIIDGVKNNIIGCKLYSQCEARARYEEQLCVGHEWRKPNFLSPSFPITITNKSRCYTTLKPEFDMIEKLETEMFDEYYRCLINGDEDSPNEECDRENFIDIKFDGAVDSPISCFNGKLRIERECGFLKVCCPRIQKCSEERRKSNVIFKILELHKQLKSQLLICKNGSKNKRRHPNNDKINEGRLNIRIGNFFNNFDRIELLSNLKEAPKEGIIYNSNLRDEKKNFVDNRKVEENLSSVISENNHKSNGGSIDNNKESSLSEIGIRNINRNNNREEESDDIKNKVKKILCKKGKNNGNSENDIKDVNSIILNEWFNNKINSENNKKTIVESSNIIEKSSRIKSLNEDEKLKERNTLNINNEGIKVTSNTISQNRKKNLLKESEKLAIEKSKKKNILNEENTLYKESSKKNKSTEKEEKGEVSDPFILLPDKFQKIYFPKVYSSTQYPPYLEIVTKDTQLTFQNVTTTKTPTKDDNGEGKYYKKEMESTMNKWATEGNNSSESINHKIVNHQLSNNYYSSQNLSKEKYEDKHEKSEFSKFITIDSHKEKNNNKNFVNKSSRINDEVNKIDILKKEYQDHLQKILELKKKEEEEMREKEEKMSFFKLNSAKKSSYEERNEELIEMTEVNSEENIMKKNNSISIREDSKGELNQISNIVKNCKLRYAGAVKILDDNTKPIGLKNSFINWKKTLDERLIKVRDDKTISIETFNEFYNAIQRDADEIAKIINSNGNEEDHDDKIFGDIICQPIENKEEEEDITHIINDNNYRKSIEMFKKTHSMAYNLRIPNETQFLTSCDYYVKCRSHINLLLDKCASLITERPAIPSTESILLSGLNMCGEINVPFLSELYSLYTKRNMNLRTCLKKHDDIGGSTEVCTNKINNLILTTKEIIKYQEEQFELGKCFSDVNNLQNKCYQMSKCCPEYEECKKTINDIKVERKMIYLTSKITENNQNCLEKYERKFFSFSK
uniref:Uncharacterized protein n=1 Tax=Strongyloides papillosus TaxID=174720 RepID=A0A0N5BP29_STREA